jgi:predicted GIY-YIG superfamily endonuclease
MKTHTVYALINPINSTPFYVGETTNLNERIKRHLKCNDRHNKEKNDFILNLLSKGMAPDIRVIAIDIKTKEEAEKIESRFIQSYKASGFVLYNKNNGGNKPPLQLAKRTQEQKQKAVNCSPQKKAVIQYTKKMEFVKEFIGVREAYRQTNIDHRSIAAVANGNVSRHTAGGFKWKYK